MPAPTPTRTSPLRPPAQALGMLSALRIAVAHNDGTLAPEDYYRYSAAASADGSSTGVVVQSFRQLSGSRTLDIDVAPTSRALFIVVACPGATNSWRAQLVGGERRRGDCGSLAGAQLPIPGTPKRLTLSVDADGDAGYAVSVYQH